MTNQFERRMELLQSKPTNFFREACIEVCDTAEAAKLWFESNGIKPTAADIVAMTALIMQRQARIIEEHTFGDMDDD